jgi:predicted RNA-binding protein with PIN domain
MTGAVLPPAVRERVVAIAADRLGRLPADEVPASLRPFRSFTPAKRARLIGTPVAAALETDPVFRQRVADGAAEAFPGLATALADGSPLPAADPVDVAALAYLLRPEGWDAHVERAAEELAATAVRVDAAVSIDAVQRLTEQLDAVRAGARAEAERVAAEVTGLKADSAALRRKVRDLGEKAAAADRARVAAEAALQGAAQQESARLVEAEAEVKRLRARLAEVEKALASAKQAAREGRHADELRLRVLLDTLIGSATGLRRELSLAPVEGRPADALEADYAVVADPAGRTAQGRADDDPQLLDALLQAPGTHLLVDGYNVTKTGYGELTLESQRQRLLSGLGALAARTGAETTVVFDGVERATPLALPAPRGVRLLFSRQGETADEVLRRLAANEPQGRPVVVVSSDREVADGVRRSGARPVAARALLRLLDR